MVRKLSKARSKLVGSAYKLWVRIPAPQFVTSVTLQVVIEREVDGPNSNGGGWSLRHFIG
jgi:hypothetical protein